ncbi:unannotated protein [freshwater metagenome]|uniref:Unannotated protein n=1 Tax=freshwater metagenome TaxID=449393 RepID=A0A6J7T992_9ZZZZ
MPPLAMASQVCSRICNALSSTGIDSRICNAWHLFRNSRANAGGNFGAVPKPPLIGSYAAVRESIPLVTAAKISALVKSGFAFTIKSLRDPMCSIIRVAESETRSRSLVQVSFKASRTWVNDGIPCEGRDGKYVPAYQGFRS